MAEERARRPEPAIKAADLAAVFTELDRDTPEWVTYNPETKGRVVFRLSVIAARMRVAGEPPEGRRR